MSLRFLIQMLSCASIAASFALAAYGQGSGTADREPPWDVTNPSGKATYHLGPVDFSGGIRIRGEVWDWFLEDTRADYGYGNSTLRLDFSQNRSRWAWKLEFEQPTVFGLPSDATSFGSPLGLGAIYFDANHHQSNAAGLFLKQGFVRIRGLAHNGDTLQLGRFAFSDGAAGRSPDPTLSWLRRERIAGRLIGDAAWSTTGRSFDGVHFSDDIGASSTVTFLAARPTEGVYQTSGWREMDVDILYASYTRDVTTSHVTSEIRVFGVGYHDGRRLVKVDNRPLQARQEDTQNIRIGTFGIDYIVTGQIPRLGKWDFLVWGAVQRGNWGRLAQRADAATAEIGWQLPISWWHPWLRAGALMGSADGNPTDDQHTTFFQMLPTDRQYARIPFYTMQNVEDYTGQAILHPSRKLQLRAEIHKVKLHGSKDLWYAGPGAFQNSSFGYFGQGDNGHRGLANFIDLSVDYHVTRRLRVTGYIGGLSGKAALTQRIDGRKAGFGYIEADYEF